MADLFEQLVADYLTEEGYLTRLNVNYRKADGKQSGSYIDVLALHRKDHRVIVGDCKSWQDGFWADWMLGKLEDNNSSEQRQRDRFKAIFDPRWAEGLATKVEKELGTPRFTYVIYCTRRRGESQRLLEIERTVAGNPIKVVTLADMVRKTAERLDDKSDESVELTTLGRFVQLLRAAKIDLGA